MENVNACEAQTHLPRLLKRVASGERITITKQGIPIAMLQPYGPVKSVAVTNVIAQLHDFRKNNTFDGLSIREMVEEGRY